MKPKRLFNIEDIEKELLSIAAHVGQQQTKEDLYKWLARLYKAAAMLTLVMEQYVLLPSHYAEERQGEQILLSEAPGALDELNIYALQALTQLRTVWRNEK